MGRVGGLDDSPRRGGASPLALAALQRVHRWPGVRTLPPWVRVCAESQGVILACLSNLIRDVKESMRRFSSRALAVSAPAGSAFVSRVFPFPHKQLMTVWQVWQGWQAKKNE